ncbi:alkaline phosphatase PhoX [Stieleria varia]|uniref:Phosphatase n=1 Tax=Stieleria varia TaxID=2528005 RepID=A0A5C6A0D9_9BACT|nr:alkaline phosphatase PhoX [Stieleria varia]TWT92003.1 hypothetical protein Pla52n_64760 [Stieleria varia]
MPAQSRRKFLSDNFSAAAGFAVAGAFGSLGSRFALGESASHRSDLSETIDDTTGLPLLRLPPGFRYRSFGWTGDPMVDGVPTPEAHDGMGVIRVDGDVLTLCRNHEISEDCQAIPHPLGHAYDPMAGGGCTTLTFDTKLGQWLSSRVAMSGTSRNCAGGVTPWGTWLTAEETVMGPNDRDYYKSGVIREFQKTHGWVFEVNVDGQAMATTPQPIRDMGRFVHEAIAIDHETGIVYETEDRATSGFYRFTPNVPGKLAAGGTLEMAEVVGQPDLRGGFPNGAEFDVRWHRIDDPSLAHTKGTSVVPTPRQWETELRKQEVARKAGKQIEATSRFTIGDELGVFKQGQRAGGSMFSRLEGCWFGNGLVYFDATSGGAAEAGQIWQFDPKQQKLKLLFESPNKPTLNMPDNLCVSPQGGLMLCEDNDYGANEYPQRIFSLSPDGKLGLFAENNVRLQGEKNGFQGDFRTKEWAGATFSPDGNWMFVNIQTPGITFAITGPWADVFVS